MFSKTRDPSANDIIDGPERLLIEAIAGREARAVDALKEWRASVTLDEASYVTHRILPMLADLIQREGVDDPDLGRMRGVSRRYWVNNVLKFRLLFTALDALEAAGIRTMLIKGAALFARSPGTEGKRRSADYDFLVLPGDLTRAGDILELRGFLPWGHSWRDLTDKVSDTSGEGIAIVLRGYVGEIDLHWRPVWNVHDVRLAERFFAAAEERDLRGHLVRVPNVTHHLFSAMARCEPEDKNECFARLVEGCVLLSADIGSVDWQELETMLVRYGLNAPALAYCDVLSRHTAIPIPNSFVDRLKESLSESLRREWRIQGMARERRSASDRQHLDRLNRQFRGVTQQFPLPGVIEVRLRDFSNPLPFIRILWRLAARRFNGAPASSISSVRFLEGFSYPEATGRWTIGKWACMAVPLTKSQQKGEPVSFNPRVFRGATYGTRVVATGGREPFVRLLARDEEDPIVRISVLPMEELGGDGLVLWWLPDAYSPRALGASGDPRDLGVYIGRDWQGSALDPDDARLFRIRRRVRPPSPAETCLRRISDFLPAHHLVWRLAQRRFTGLSARSPRFLEGFGLLEPGGRRTDGEWALMTVPLTRGQRKGKPVRFSTQVFLRGAAEVRLTATGGREAFTRRMASDGTDPGLELSVRPLRELGGDGLVLISLRGAVAAHGSQGRQEPSLLVHNDWQAGIKTRRPPHLC
jgi:hypothetical protein